MFSFFVEALASGLPVKENIVMQSTYKKIKP